MSWKIYWTFTSPIMPVQSVLSKVHLHVGLVALQDTIQREKNNHTFISDIPARLILQPPFDSAPFRSFGASSMLQTPTPTHARGSFCHPRPPLQCTPPGLLEPGWMSQSVAG